MKRFSILSLFLFISAIVLGQSTRPDFFLPDATNLTVNSYAGNLNYQRSDFFIPGRGLDIDITFNYNSAVNRDWGYGYGWSNNYNISLNFESDGKYIITWGDNARDVFLKTGNVYNPPVGVYHKLEEYSGGHKLTTKTGMKYYFEGFGRVDKIEDRNNNSLTFTYNQDGITSITDASGRVIQFLWVSGKLVEIVDNLNTPTRTWFYEYNNRGNLAKVTNPLGHEIQYSYGALNPNHLVGVVDENYNETIISYQIDGYVKTVSTCFTKHEFSYDYENGEGKTFVKEIVGDDYQTTTYEYNSQGVNTGTSGNCCGNESTPVYDFQNNLIQNTDANGNVWQYEYDANGNQITITNPKGCIETFTYSGDFSLVTSKTDALGNITNYEYDSKGNLITESRPLGAVELTEYDIYGNTISFTDANGNITTAQFNSNGEMIETVYPDGSTRTYAYDNRGNLLSETNQNGFTTSYEYDLLNRLIKTIDANGSEIVFAYDNKGNKISETNALGHQTTFEYDQFDRMIKNNAPENIAESFVYDSHGNIIKHIDRSGNTTTNTYYSNDKIESKKDPYGNSTHYTYDANGNLILMIDPNGKESSYTYDALDRLIEMINPSGLKKIITYDCLGNLLSVTDENSIQRSYEYDQLGRNTSIISGGGEQTNFEYDKNGNNIKIIDAKGNETIYIFNNRNQNTEISFADGTSVHLSYDNIGNITERIDNSGVSTIYEYDNLNRLITRNYPGSNDDIFSYDILGQLISVSNENAVIQFQYDAVGQLKSETLNGKTTNYHYYWGTSKVTTVYPNGQVIENHFNKNRQLDLIKYNGNVLVNFGYDPSGRLISRTYSNGTNAFYSYSVDLKITSINHEPGNLIDFNYGYDNSGNKAYEEKVHPGFDSEKYTYDANYRLTEFLKGELVNGEILTPSSTIQYNYDEVGNRVSVNDNSVITTYSSNQMNEYESISNTETNNLTYDEKGNLTSDGANNYNYDYENRLISITGNLSVEYKYDPLGRRIKKITPQEQITFYYSGDRVILEQDASGSDKKTFVYGLWIDDIIFSDSDAGKFFYHKNALGSVVGISDESTQFKEFYEYDPYGEVYFYDETLQPINTSQFSNLYLFTGRMLDSESNKYYYRARYYDFDLGRFLQMDPLGYVDGMNLYEYGKGNALNNFDPSGLLCDPVSLGVTTTVVVVDFIGSLIISGYLVYSFSELSETKSVIQDYKPQCNTCVKAGVREIIKHQIHKKEIKKRISDDCERLGKTCSKEIDCKVETTHDHGDCLKKTGKIDHHHFFINTQTLPPECNCYKRRIFGDCGPCPLGPGF